jgi:RNase H-like domain found in reverse transcriptase
VWVIIHLRPYLEGHKFIIRTHHHSLRWVLNLSDAQGRLAPWRLRLLEFDYVHYHPGALHHGADMISMLRSEDPAITEPTDEIDTDVPCFALAHSPLVTGNEELHPPGKRDPSLVHPDFVLDAKGSNPSCMHLREHLGPLPLIDVDQNGLLGVVLPSREFQLAILPSLVYLSPSPSSTKSRYLSIRRMSLATFVRQNSGGGRSDSKIDF